MNVSNFMHGWVVLLGSLATFALILMAFEIMLGMGKTGDAAKHLGSILGIVIVLMLASCIIMCAWSGMALWQQICLVATGTCIWQWQHRSQGARKGTRGKD